MITQTYNLNLVPDKVPVSVDCSQYDSLSRTIIFNIYDGTVLKDLTGATATVRGTKQDNTGFEYPCTVNGSTVSFDIQDQMTVFSGKVPCEIRLINNGILGTCNFVLNVEPTPLDPNVTISETDLPLLEEAEQNAIRAEQAADEAESLLSTVVKSVNNTFPDAQGNVTVQTSSPLSAGTGIDISNDVVSNTAPIWHGNEVGDLPVPIDADLLQGHEASYYQLQYEDVWTNPDSTSDFGNQTINLGHTNILGVTIKFLEQKTNTRMFAKTVFRSGANQTIDMFLGLCFTSAPYILFQRPFNINFTEGTISFESAYAMPTYATYGNIQNNYGIPLSVTIYYQR